MVYLKTIDVTVAPVANSQSVVVTARDHDMVNLFPMLRFVVRIVFDQSQTDQNAPSSYA